MSDRSLWLLRRKLHADRIFAPCWSADRRRGDAQIICFDVQPEIKDGGKRTLLAVGADAASLKFASVLSSGVLAFGLVRYQWSAPPRAACCVTWSALPGLGEV